MTKFTHPQWPHQRTKISHSVYCNQAHGRDNKASKTTSRTMLQRAPNTQHAARSTACCLDSLGPRDISRPLFIDTSSTLLLPTFQSPLYVDFGLLRRTGSYFLDLTLIVTRVTLYTPPVTLAHSRPTHNALLHLALERSVRGLECTQHSVHRKS